MTCSWSGMRPKSKPAYLQDSCPAPTMIARPVGAPEGEASLLMRAATSKPEVISPKIVYELQRER